MDEWLVPWYPVACEHGYDHCPTCDKGLPIPPLETGPVVRTPGPDLGDDPDGDNTTEWDSCPRPGCAWPACACSIDQPGVIS